MKYRNRLTKFLLPLFMLSAWILTFPFHREDSSYEVKKNFDIRLQNRSLKIELLKKKMKTDVCLSNQKMLHTVKVSNTSNFPVFSSLKKPHGVNLAYRVYSDSKKIVYESPRIVFADGLPALSQSVVNLEVLCPEKPGVYKVVIDMVQEGIAWNHLLDSPHDYPELTIRVPSIPKDFSDLGLLESAKRIAEIIVANSISLWPDNRNIIVSFAGSQYPQIWARDMASIQRGLLSMNPTLVLKHHWSELFFERFDSSTGIPDWISPLNHNQDKNDILSDQELWTIISASEAVLQGNLDGKWLEKHISDLKRLIDWVIEHRWNTENSCLWTGHTVDWGDVGPKGFGSDSTKMHPPKVCSAFSQGLLYQALKLLSMLPNRPIEHAGPYTISHLLGLIVSFSTKELWQPQLGFYKIHKHLESLNHDFDESRMFSLGGHVLMIESGLVSRAKQVRIVDVILQKQHMFQVSTIGGNLLPSYPKGFFQHPMMDETYEYQNGGQWDWYGCRAAFAVFQTYPVKGRKALEQIARKVRKNGTFYEWDHLDGSPGAGPHYRASAASFLWALSNIKSFETASFNKL